MTIYDPEHIIKMETALFAVRNFCNLGAKDETLTLGFPKGYNRALQDVLSVLDDYLNPNEIEDHIPMHRTEAGWPNCSTCDGGGCHDCTEVS